MIVLTTGVRTSDAPQIFRGMRGETAPHDEHSGRLLSILNGIESIYSPTRTTRDAQDSELVAIHDPGLIDFYREMAATPQGMRPTHPDSFPVRRGNPPHDLVGKFGYYCTGTQTPFTNAYWSDALRAAGCALEGARQLLDGEELTYVACRPPGHHAGPDYFGGYCYLNNTALAAEQLSQEGRTAILDVDYHHGNGTQDCFYASGSVLTISIHADTRFAYPHFSGSSEETGTGHGSGCNVNLPLPLDASTENWFGALDEGLERISDWEPDFLVVAFGADTYRRDPVGGFSLDIDDYETLGRRITSLGLPTLVLQEGGYAVDALGSIVASLLTGLSGDTRIEEGRK